MRCCVLLFALAPLSGCGLLLDTDPIDAAAAPCQDLDRDGFFTQATCGGPLDCDDGNPAVGSAGERRCYTGGARTRGQGSCRDGVELCNDGLWTGCIGQILPSGETCNGLDDDCNGLDDDALPDIACGEGACRTPQPSCRGGTRTSCTSPTEPMGRDCGGPVADLDCDGQVNEDCGCVYVRPGLRPAPALDPTSPAGAVTTIQAAIDWAATDARGPWRVCVGSPGCEPATFLEALTMADGISVHGGFDTTTVAAIGWTRTCANRVHTIANTTPEGIRFGNTIRQATELSGFTIQPIGRGDANGVTVKGAQQVFLTDLAIDEGEAGPEHTRGILVTRGGHATIRRSHVHAGSGSVTAHAVEARGAQVEIRDNCVTPAAAGCTATCDALTTGLGLFAATGALVTARESAAVSLVDAGGSRVERSSLCGGAGAFLAFGVVAEGDVDGIRVDHNAVAMHGAAFGSVAVALRDCRGGMMYVDHNPLLQAITGATALAPMDALAAGVTVGDGCSAQITGNSKIEGSTAREAFGIACGLPTGGSCIVEGNAWIQGSGDPQTEQSSGVACGGPGCERVVDNGRIDGGDGKITSGVALLEATGLVRGNQIYSGCGRVSAIGVGAASSSTRLVNNLIVAGYCPDPVSGQAVTGLGVLAGASHIDAHSNTVVAVGTSSPCFAAALGLIGSPGAAPSGIYRNNILLARGCSTRSTAVFENETAADPMVFEHNNLDPMGGALPYWDEGTTPLDLAAVNAMADVFVAGGNISVPSNFVDAVGGDFHLAVMPPSMCIDAGTDQGAPDQDFEGDPRGALPDIGMDEAR